MTGNPRNAMVCDTPYLQNEYGDPDFFTLLILTYHFLAADKVLKKSVRGKFLGANVLKCLLKEKSFYLQSIKKTISRTYLRERVNTNL